MRLCRFATWLAFVSLLVAGHGIAAAAPAHLFADGGTLFRLSPEAGVELVAVEAPVSPAVVFTAAGEQALVGVEESGGNDLRAAGWELWSVPLAGGEARPLLPKHRVMRAAASAASGLMAVETADSKLLLADLDGRLLRSLGPGVTPAFSPDGRRLAFARVPEAGADGIYLESQGIVVHDLLTGTETRLTRGSDDDFEPFFTPDGGAVLFRSGSRTGLTSLWRVDLHGGEPRQLTHQGRGEVDEAFVPNYSYNRDLRWSADGRRLLYGTYYSPEGEVMVLRFDDAGAVAEARQLGTGRWPAWSELGTVLAVAPGGSLVELDPAAAPVTVDVAEAARTAPGLLAPVEPPAAPEGTTWSSPRFRWPVDFHPSGSYYYFDLDSGGGTYSWKCTTGQTYNGHKGTDIPVVCGTWVRAGAGGTTAKRNDGCASQGSLGDWCGSGFGNYFKIAHSYGFDSIYAHMQNGSVLYLPNGAGLYCGTTLGKSCASGNTDGAHLHMEVRNSGTPEDPFAAKCWYSVSYWCNQNGAGTDKPGTGCC